jgi:dTDP-4-amino-4,6-dideoxygalactose transaminase
MTITGRDIEVPFLDLAAHHEPFSERLAEAFDECLTTSGFVGGQRVAAFEQRWASVCQTEYSVGVANGTDAIEIALAALGVGPGDEVIVPTNTFVATAAAVVRVGARPVFCDVDPRTLLISEDTASQALGPDVVAVIAVHLFGQPANMDELKRFASRHQLALIEDAAQAHCARWDGDAVGSFGEVATFSFYPGKNLGALGDGGAICTNDAEIEEACREIANHGRSTANPHTHGRVGRNSRLDGLQAAFLDIKLTELAAANEKRRAAHRMYTELLPDSVEQVYTDARAESVHHLEVVRVPDRERLREELTAVGIGTGIHYLTPCHALEPFGSYRRADTPVADQAASEILSLPMYPELEPSAISRVCDVLASLVGHEQLASARHAGS